MKCVTFAVVLLVSSAIVAEEPRPSQPEPPQPVRLSLWSGRAPIEADRFEKGDAFITVHLPAKAAVKSPRAALVICPGGGYGGLVRGPEGHGIAKWLNGHGIVGVVLEYRLPRGRHEVPLLDAQRAIRTVRANAKKWGIDSSRIGIMGFSAGGHLASTAATQFAEGKDEHQDPVERVSCRPDFAILVYPVVTMGPGTHGGSRRNLLGARPSAELVERFSSEKQVTDRTPPIFLTHAKDDRLVRPVNSRQLYEALQKRGVRSRYLELPSGGHGLNGYKGPMWDAWQKQSLEWLAELELVANIESYRENPGKEGNGDFVVGPDYRVDPDLTDRGNPKGRSFEFSMRLADSKIFRGDDPTLEPGRRPVREARKIFVYIPATYTDGNEAPILVMNDGPSRLNLVRNALDNLTISEDPARRLPAFIAISVQNGGSDSKNSQRGLEYDTMSDRFARFINDEVLPAVLSDREIRAAYPKLRFTDNPWGRAAMGCSSGGAAALTMGWFRPDLFRRLITYSGTFVDQQDDDAPEEAKFPLGAWEYHSGSKLIENSAKKPLRIFTHVADRDNGADRPEPSHHNWVRANRRTAAALKAKGYDYRFVFSRGSRHCDRRVFEHTLAETLVWMWRGYPAD